MSHQHYTDCHLHHFPCALERIRDLERELAKYRVPTFSGHVLTHSAYLPCGSGPTWSHPCDDPPSTTP